MLRKELRVLLLWAQAKQAELANGNRLPAPEFKEGDLLMLDSRNLRTKRPSPTLDSKNRDPFRIKRAIDNVAYELQLPPSMARIHPIFHPWLLHLFEYKPRPGQIQDEEMPAEFDPDVEDDTDYAVESIRDCRVNLNERDGRKKGLLQYKAR
ncbi:hypothetical protein J1614_011716 [Plenodomus biglobosus]|nr:hypothetical protein J1614_011716 [Plenodomus biglobosus]